jgi:hypothetical protein
MKGNMQTNTPSFALNLLQVAARGPGLPDKGIFFACNRDRKTAVLLTGFSCFEEIQGAFRCGILMPDGYRANGIGRCASRKDFLAKAKHGGWTVLE